MDAVKNLKNLLTMYFGSMPDDTIYSILKDAIKDVESEMDEKNKEITSLTGKLVNARFLLGSAKLRGIGQLPNGPTDDPFDKNIGVAFVVKMPVNTPINMFEDAIKHCLEEFQDDRQ